MRRNCELLLSTILYIYISLLNLKKNSWKTFGQCNKWNFWTSLSWGTFFIISHIFVKPPENQFESFLSSVQGVAKQEKNSTECWNSWFCTWKLKEIVINLGVGGAMLYSWTFLLELRSPDSFFLVIGHLNMCSTFAYYTFVF